MIFWIVGIVVWVACSVLSYGLNLGYWQGKWLDVNDKYQDIGFAISVSWCGPISLGVTFFECDFGKYGFKWR